MLKDERKNQILQMLKTSGRVEVSTLCRMYNVTEMTIRRDLADLAEQNLVIRSHGGAILPPNNILVERPYELRITKNLAEKEAIAKCALPLITEGERVFFDNSTTVYALARMIGNEQKLLAVTDTLSTAIELNSRTQVRVVCLGGEMQKSTGSCAGVFAENMLESMHFTTAFIGLSNISTNGILSTSSMSEMTIKQQVIERSDHVVVMVDSSKFGPPDFLEIGQLGEGHTFITDSRIPEDFVQECRQKGVNVLIASV